MLKILFLSLTMITFASCIGERQYTPIKYYDFGTPDLQEIQLNIDNFTTEGPYKERFISRMPENLLVKDEYTRWAQAPDLLLNHYFKQSFQPGSLYFLSGEILTIEHNLAQKKAVFKVIYSISKEGRVVTQELFQRSFKTDGSIKNFVEQVSLAVKELNLQISDSVAKQK